MVTTTENKTELVFKSLAQFIIEQCQGRLPIAPYQPSRQDEDDLADWPKEPH
jgi:hypothetical protein